MKNLSPVVQKIVAVALFVAVLVVIASYLLAPLYNYYSEELDEVHQLQQQLRRFRLLLNNEERIDREMKRIEDLGASGDLFLPGNKPAIASANLRALVTQAMDRSGGRLVSSQAYEAEAIPSTTAIGLRLRINGEVENLVGLIYRLETARPLILVENLTVTSSSSRIRRVTGRRRNLSGSTLDIRMDIVAFLAGEAE